MSIVVCRRCMWLLKTTHRDLVEGWGLSPRANTVRTPAFGIRICLSRMARVISWPTTEPIDQENDFSQWTKRSAARSKIERKNKYMLVGSHKHLYYIELIACIHISHRKMWSALTTRHSILISIPAIFNLILWLLLLFAFHIEMVFRFRWHERCAKMRTRNRARFSIGFDFRWRQY